MNSNPRFVSRAAIAAILGITLSSCSYPGFAARREVDRAADATGVASFACASHNGGIELVGHSGATEFRVHAVLEARGDTQELADRNVALLDVELRRDGDRLVLVGTRPEDFDSRASPSFSFTIQGPERLVTDLTTHNGSVMLRGLQGATRVTTHNGHLSLSLAADDVYLETHNGSVELELAGSGPVRGAITSHNGTITLGLGARAAVVEASTHNGSVRTTRADAEASGGKANRRIVVGEGGGTISVETHNGSVIVR